MSYTTENGKLKKEAPLPKIVEPDEEARKAAEAEKAAAFQNDMQMQMQFFALREKFFLMLCEKAFEKETTEYFETSFQNAHELAKHDFLARCEEAEPLVAAHGMKMKFPILYKLLKDEANE